MQPARPFYVTDTHPFLWHLAGDRSRLGYQAKAVLDRAELGEAVVIIPAVVLAEALYIAEKERVRAKLEQIFGMVENALNYRFCPLDLPIIHTAWELRKLREIHDRIIVATAKELGLELITDDGEIRESGYVRTVW